MGRVRWPSARTKRHRFRRTKRSFRRTERKTKAYGASSASIGTAEISSDVSGAGRRTTLYRRLGGVGAGSETVRAATGGAAGEAETGTAALAKAGGATARSLTVRCTTIVRLMILACSLPSARAGGKRNGSADRHVAVPRVASRVRGSILSV